MPSVQNKTLYDKVYAAHLIANDTIYIDRYSSSTCIYVEEEKLIIVRHLVHEVTSPVSCNQLNLHILYKSLSNHVFPTASVRGAPKCGEEC